MLRHIGLAAVALALVTLTADSVHGRGGMRGHSSFRYNFGAGSFSAGNYYPSGAGAVSSYYRGSSGTASRGSRKSANTAGNTLSSEEASATSAATTSSVTRRGAGLTGGANTSTTQQTPATTVSQTATQPLVASMPLAITSALSNPLTQDPNTAAERTYRGLLHNAKALIKAGIYPPAVNDLQRIISGAPGTRIAAEAQRLLSMIPTI